MRTYVATEGPTASCLIKLGIRLQLSEAVIIATLEVDGECAAAGHLHRRDG